MPRKGENIRKRTDGRWEGRYIYCRDINGRAKYRSIYGKSYLEVKSRLQFLNGIRASEQELTRHTTITFGFAAAKWLAMCELKLKRSTVVKYTEQLHKHILPQLSDIKVSLITGTMIVELLKIKSEYLSSSSVHTLLTIIKSVLRFSRLQGWCAVNISDLCLPSKPSHNPNVLSKEECQRLEELLRNEMGLPDLGIYLCMYTGLRVGELCALRWGNIDFVNNTLTVLFTLQRLRKTSSDSTERTEITITEPKSPSAKRTIPLPLPLITILRMFQSSENCFLLTGSEKPMEPRVVQYRFKKYANQLGLSCSNMHALRHTFATRCIELGFDAKSLSEILGHARVDLTLNRYVHSSDSFKRMQMDLLYSNDGQNSGHHNREFD